MDPIDPPIPDQARSPPPVQEDDLQVEYDEIELQDSDEQECPASSRNATGTRAKGRSRVTVVCAECKRLKLRCDRRRPCGKCIDRNAKSKCVYDGGANGKIDIYTLNNRLISAENTISALVAFIGILQEDYNEVRDAKKYPPRPDFRLRADVKNLRAALGLTEHQSSLARPTYFGDKRQKELTVRGSDPVGQAVLVPLTNPKTRNPSTPSWIGGPGPSIGTMPRRQVLSAHRPNSGASPSMDLVVARSMLDITSRVFSTNSTPASEEITKHLELWARPFGWERDVLYRGAPAAPSVDASNDNGRFSLAALSSEGSYHDRPRAAGSGILQFADQSFHSGPAANGPPIADFTFTTSSLGSSFNAFDLTFPPTSFPGSGAPSTLPVPNLFENPVGQSFVNPHDVLFQLPSGAWRDTLWAEAENLMLTHEAIHSFSRSGLFKRQVDSMFQWAEMCVEKERYETQDSPDTFSSLSGSTATSNRASGPRLTAFRRPGSRGESLVEEAQSSPPPTPPTLSFCAVVSAAFALGALGYLCKSQHGLTGTMEAREKQKSPATLPSKVFPTSTSTGESFASVNFGSLGFMRIQPSAMTFSMTGNGQLGGMPSNLIPTRSTHDPTPSPTHDPTKHPLPDHFRPHVLHELSRAFLLNHDTLRHTHSLDYLHAHVLGWVYMLHPPDDPRTLPDANGGPCRGIAGGLVTTVDQRIRKEISKCATVARAMGLNVAEGFGGDEQIMGIPGLDAMPWEREMRKRVWWTIAYFELFVLGTLPSTLADSNSCEIPNDVDESRFDPQSTSLPPPDDPHFSMTHWIHKLRLVEILRPFHYSFVNGRGVSPQALEAFTERLDKWQQQLPICYGITIDKPSPSQTVFPYGQTGDVLACDLLIFQNRLIVDAWYPYLGDALAHPMLPLNQRILSACADAAIAILVASKHLVTRFRGVRSISFGYYEFGQPVWLAATLLACLAIAVPESPLAELIGEGLSFAVEIVSNPVVGGKADGATEEEHGVIVILNHLKAIFKRLLVKSPSTRGTKRKSIDSSGTIGLQNSTAMPHVGPSLATASSSLPWQPSPPSNLPESIAPSGSSRSTTAVPATDDFRRRAQDARQVDRQATPPGNDPARAEQSGGSPRGSDAKFVAARPTKRPRHGASSCAEFQLMQPVDGPAIIESSARKKIVVRKRRDETGISAIVEQGRTNLQRRAHINAAAGPSNSQNTRNSSSASAPQPSRIESDRILHFEDPTTPSTGHRSFAPPSTFSSRPGVTTHYLQPTTSSSASDVILVDPPPQAPSSAFHPPYTNSASVYQPQAYQQTHGFMTLQGRSSAYGTDMEVGSVLSGASYAESALSAPGSTMVQAPGPVEIQYDCESSLSIDLSRKQTHVDDVASLNNTLSGFPTAGSVAPTPGHHPTTDVPSSFLFDSQNLPQLAPQAVYAPPVYPLTQHYPMPPPSNH